MTQRSNVAWFCGNCEEEFHALPSGLRSKDRRPLCGRCTEIAGAEGWGVSSVTDTIRAVPVRFRLVKVAVLLACLAAAAVAYIFYALILNGGRR